MIMLLVYLLVFCLIAGIVWFVSTHWKNRIQADSA